MNKKYLFNNSNQINSSKKIHQILLPQIIKSQMDFSNTKIIHNIKINHKINNNKL